MKLLTVFFSIILTLSFSISIAQVIAPEIEWQNTIGGVEGESLNSIEQTPDGGYILGGWSSSGISYDKTELSQGFSDYWVVKVNSVGDIEWQNSIGGSSYDNFYSLHQTSDGGYILGGSSLSGISGDKTEACIGDYDYWVLKIDSVGNIEWQNTIGGNDGDRLKTIQQTTDGGYIVGGYSSSGISGDKSEASEGADDYWVVKLDINGAIEWQNTIGGSSYDNLNSIQQCSDGGYVMCGNSESGISGDKIEASQGGSDYWVVKLDNGGVIEWQNTIGGSGKDWLWDIQQTTDGGYILAGFSDSGISGDKTEPPVGYEDFWVVKLNSTGIIEWQNTIGGNDYERFCHIKQTLDGGFILGGYSSSGISGDKTEDSQGWEDYWVVKLYYTGAIEWQNTIGGDNTDVLISMEQTADSGYILGGQSISEISGDKTEPLLGGYYDEGDYWVVKLFPEPPLPCNADFILVADTLVPHHYWGINQASGILPISYVWSWGDGLYDSIAYPSHTYAAGGYYTICLSIQDSAGCADSICISYNIQKMSGENTIVKIDIVDSIPSLPVSIQNPDLLQSWSVFPNPSPQNIFIRYMLSGQATVSFCVYDVFWNKLQQLLVKNLEPGNHLSIIDAEKFPDGIYFLQIRTGNYIELKKIVVMK